MNQLLGSLKVDLLPDSRGLESWSEQDFGLCWVEVICETKSINFRPWVEYEFQLFSLFIKYNCKVDSSRIVIEILTLGQIL